MSQPLLFLERFSLPVTAQLVTVFPLPVANLALSLPKSALLAWSTLEAQTNSLNTCKLFTLLTYQVDSFPFSLEIFALFMLTGIFSTLLLPETKNKSLEELSNEDQENFVSGVVGDEKVEKLAVA